MTDDAEAQAAIEALNGIDLLGNTLTVIEAGPQPEPCDEAVFAQSPDSDREETGVSTDDELIRQLRSEVMQRVGAHTRSTRWLKTVIVVTSVVFIVWVGTAVVAGIFVARRSGSVWFGVLAGIYVLAFAQWTTLPFGGRRYVRCLVALTKATVLSMAATALVKYTLDINWLAAVTGIVVLSASFGAFMPRPARDDSGSV